MTLAVPFTLKVRAIDLIFHEITSAKERDMDIKMRYLLYCLILGMVGVLLNAIADVAGSRWGQSPDANHFQNTAIAKSLRKTCCPIPFASCFI